MIKTENDIFTYYGQKRRLRDGGFLVDMARGGHGGAHKLSSCISKVTNFSRIFSLFRPYG